MFIIHNALLITWSDFHFMVADLKALFKAEYSDSGSAKRQKEEETYI